jgi:hypothetical protein
VKRWKIESILEVVFDISMVKSEFVNLQGDEMIDRDWENGS